MKKATFRYWQNFLFRLNADSNSQVNKPKADTNKETSFLSLNNQLPGLSVKPTVEKEQVKLQGKIIPYHRKNRKHEIL